MVKYLRRYFSGRKTRITIILILDARSSIMGLSKLKPGMKILYEERSLDPKMDDEAYERQKEFLTKEAFASAYARSPEGYLLLSKYSCEWCDPNNPRRRVILGVIFQIRDDLIYMSDIGSGLPATRVLEVLPDDWTTGI
jgi:hypothetical protein